MDHTRELPHCAMSNFMIADARPNWKEQPPRESLTGRRSAAPQIFSYPQVCRPILPSFGGKADNVCSG